MTEQHDYLWDGSGPVDPEVARLEQVLRPLAYRHRPAPVLPRLPDGVSRSRWAAGPLLLMAAILLMALGLGWWTVPVPVSGPAEVAYRVLDRQGPSWVDGQPIAGGLRVGEQLVTGAGRLRLDLGGIGQLEIFEHSQLMVREVGANRHDLYLEQGTIRAFVTAPPRLFQVETPLHRAVDLGCLYTLEVDDQGSRLTVEMGAVEVQATEGIRIVPAGATVGVGPGGEIGTLIPLDAPGDLVAAIREFDAGGPLEPVLARLEAADRVTLWSLLTHPSPAVREALYPYLIALYDPPATATRAQTIGLDGEALRAWRYQLQLFGPWWEG